MIFILLCWISVGGFAQKRTSMVLWQAANQLAAKDFKARPNKLSSFAGLTASGISIDISYTGNLLVIETAATFNPRESWLKDKEDPNLLKHEQFHFNITELYAREFRKKVLNKKFTARGKKLIKEVTSLYENVIKDLDRYQEKYDKETDHSINRKAQKEWEETVLERLKAMKEYANPQLTINL